MDLIKIHKDEKGILIGFAESRIGGRAENQDSFGCKNTDLGYVITVCDGMGGGPAGKTASTIAVNEILTGIDEARRDEEIPNVIIKAIRRANMAIIEAGNEKPSMKGMGSTATVLLISNKSAFAAHVGDSRIYQFRGHKKVFRTFDHSMVFEMVSQRVITEEQARLSANSNVITRALGVTPDVEVDIKELPYEKGDRFMLCTDGVHGTMPETELIKLATKSGTQLGILTDDLATIVDNIGRTSGGGHDNLTLAIIETKINSKLKPKMSKQTKIFLVGLLLLFAISLAMNGYQFIRYDSENSEKQEINELKIELLRKDTILEEKDTLINNLTQEINELKDKLKGVSELVNGIPQKGK